MNYIEKILKAVAMGTVDAKSITNAVVEHEDGCNSFDGGGCDCDPSVLINTDKGWLEVLDNGLLIETTR